MATRTEPGTLIELASLPDLRDIGGYPARGGRVQTGVLYRSTELNKLADDDRATLGRFGIRTVFDLRYLHSAFDEKHSRFGSIGAYFSQGLGIDAGDQRALNAILVS